MAWHDGQVNTSAVALEKVIGTMRCSGWFSFTVQLPWKAPGNRLRSSVLFSMLNMGSSVAS